MKIYLYIFFLICLTVAIGCNYSKSYLSNNTKECSIVSKDTSFEKHIFPIIETKYRTSDIIKYFKRGVKIDSGFNKNSNGDTVLFYKYYDDSSQFIFSLNDYSKKMYNFDIAVFRLNSDLINLKNGIKPGMNRKVFFNIIILILKFYC